MPLAPELPSHDEFEAWHAEEHPEPEPGCLACKLDTVQVGAALHAARATKVVRPRTPDNPWERGRAGEHRIDGSFMPLLDEKFATIGVKKAAEQHHHIEEFRRRSEATKSAAMSA